MRAAAPFPSEVRVAFGTGVLLGFWQARLSVAPTTAHLLVYSPGGCSANCGFCAQARGSRANPDLLSRVPWPVVRFREVVERLKDCSVFRRVCCQGMNFPGAVDVLFRMVSELRSCGLPLSVCCQPLSPEEMERFRELGVERVCVPLDGASPEIFDKVKGERAGGPYRWEEHWNSLRKAARIFRGRVTTHLLVGLGETEEEIFNCLLCLRELGVEVALFAFTPIRGTALEHLSPPSLKTYRRVQMARYLLSRGEGGVGLRNGRLVFQGERAWRAVESGEPFLTSGCPGCNRPFFNESPRGPIYNFPRMPTREELREIRSQLAPAME